MTKEEIIELATARQTAGPLNTGATPELIWDLIIEVANLTGGGSDPGYLEYAALLTQTGENAPVATLLGTNTVGNIVWTRIGIGNYEGTLSGAFTSNKTWLMISPSMTDPTAGPFTGFIFIRVDNNTLRLHTVFAPDMTDGQLFEQSISIRVYP